MKRLSAMHLVALAGVMIATFANAGERIVVGEADFAPVLAPAPGQTQIHISTFRLEATPVTNGQFLAFVRTHPAWRRDRVPSLFADGEYLSHWAAADELGADARPQQPVTRVSWYAARAYCTAAGARLPSWYEWELAAAADEARADARSSPAWRARILEWYARPGGQPLRRTKGVSCLSIACSCVVSSGQTLEHWL